MSLKFNKDQCWKIKDNFISFEEGQFVPSNIPEEILSQMIEHGYVTEADKPAEPNVPSANKPELPPVKEPEGVEVLTEKEVILAEFKKLGIKADKRLSVDKLTEQLQEAKEAIAEQALKEADNVQDEPTQDEHEEVEEETNNE